MAIPTGGYLEAQISLSGMLVRPFKSSHQKRPPQILMRLPIFSSAVASDTTLRTYRDQFESKCPINILNGRLICVEPHGVLL